MTTDHINFYQWNFDPWDLKAVIFPTGFFKFGILTLLLDFPPPPTPPDPAFLQTAQPDCERQQPGQSHRVPQRVEVAFSPFTLTENILRKYT